jgi:hypothetical protein
MKAQKLKLQIPGIVQTALQTSETARSPQGRLGELPGYANHARSARRFTNLLVALQKLSGFTLSGIGVSILIGNLLICAALLLLGPAVILDLLSR